MKKELRTIFWLFGIVFLGISGVGLFGTINFKQSAQTANGDVVLITENKNAIIQFETPDKKPQTFLAGGIFKEHYTAGQSVAVIYNTSDPTQADINSFLSLWAEPLMYAVAGLFILLLNLLIKT